MNLTETNIDNAWQSELDIFEDELEFPPGTLLFSAGAIFRVLNGSTANRLIVQEDSSKDIRTQTQSFLRQAIADGCMSVISADESTLEVSLQYRMRGLTEEWIENIPASCRSDAAVKVMLEKRNWLKWLQQHNVMHFRPSEELAMKIKELEIKHGKCPYGMDTLYKEWLKQKKSHGDAKVHLPKFHLRGGANGTRLESEVELIVQKILMAKSDKNSGKIQTSRVRLEIAHAVENLNRGRDPLVRFAIPSAPTVQRRLKQHFGAYAIAERNFGRARANKLFRENGTRVRAERALDIVEYDDTDTCIYTIDSRTGLPWGRCYATFGVDQKTKKVAGTAISEKRRSTISAYQTVIHALSRKDPHHPDLALCKHPWIAFGNQGLALFDNATYNAANSLQTALIDLGLQFEFARPYHPTNKSCIEYFNHRLKSGFCSNLVGWSGGKEDREALSHGIGTAVMTRQEMVQMMNRWITDDYSNALMECGNTPNTLWARDFALHDPFMPLKMPSDELIMTIPTTLKFRDSGGLLRKGLRYQSATLAEIRRKLGRRAEIKVRYMHDRLDYLFVEDPFTLNYVKVPCIEDPQVYLDVTDLQQSLILKRARQLFGKQPDLSQLMNARNALVEETKTLMHSKKMRERKRSLDTATLAVTDESTEIMVQSGKTETVVMSDLEYTVMQMEEEHSMSDDDMQVISLGDVE